MCICVSCSWTLPGSSVHGFSRQEYQSGLPCSPPGDLPNPGIEPTALNGSRTGWWILYHQRHLGSPLLQIAQISVSNFLFDCLAYWFVGIKKTNKHNLSLFLDICCANISSLSITYHSRFLMVSFYDEKFLFFFFLMVSTLCSL